MEGVVPLRSSSRVVQHQPKANYIQINQQDTHDNYLDYQGDTSPVKGDEHLFFHRGGLQHKYVQRFRQGKLPIELEIDLHGFTVEQAEKSLLHFLQTALSNSLKVVCIIHGKGLRSQLEYPPMKNLVNTMLRQHTKVLAFCSAQPADGGKGATYVLLKRMDKANL